MFIGYVLTYKQWFSNQIGDAFSKLVLQIALPCNMFLTITEELFPVRSFCILLVVW
ncbi:MAG: hypothetical protein ACLT90_06020 [Enterococcus raffinosus]